MPIFMDRHYKPGVTHRDVALAHESDVRIQAKYGIHLFTYWFDEQRSTTFCLAEAPEKKALSRLHADAHGDIPEDIIEVESSAVEAFLGRVSDPQPVPEDDGPPLDAAFRAIMFTDLSDFTRTTAALGDAAAMRLLRKHNSLVREALDRNHGHEVKLTGDGIMASFAPVPDALRCAVDIEVAFSAYNRSHPDGAMHVRIGISAGEPVEESGDLFGSAVQLAARVCDAAKPDQVLVAEVVMETVGADDGFRLIDAGERVLKGFESPVRLFEVAWHSNALTQA